MGAWGTEAWDNDGAADWFAAFFEGIDVPARLRNAFRHYDAYDEIRAASYILEHIGRIYVWPGTGDDLRELLDTAIELLRAMIDPDAQDDDMDFLELWDSHLEVIASVRSQITALEMRRSEIVRRNDKLLP